MKASKAIKTMLRRRDYLASREIEENSESAHHWNRQERAAIEFFLAPYGALEPQPDMNDLRAFRKMEGNVI